MLKGIWCYTVAWIYLAEDRKNWHTLVNMVMNFQVP